jgi:hypothetical protein
MRPVKLGPHSYSFPPAYGPTNSGGGIDTPPGTVTFRFLVLLPGLAPRNEENKQQIDAVGWHDQLRGLFQYNPKDRPLTEAQMLANDLSQPWIDPKRAKMTEGGYKVFIPKFKSEFEVWTKTRPDGGTFVMECAQDGFAPYPDCSVLEFWEGAELYYGFSRTYAENAVEIDAKVKRMLASFRK